MADAGNNRIQKFSPIGEFLGTWGTGASDKGQFLGPLGIAVGLSGDVYVTDTRNNRVQMFRVESP